MTKKWKKKPQTIPHLGWIFLKTELGGFKEIKFSCLFFLSPILT